MDTITIQCDPDLEDLIPGYMNNRRKDITVIRECLKDDNFAQIHTLGHSMKGSGGGYGFDEITDLGSRLELAALASNKDEIDQVVETLEDYVNRVEVVYS
ncbi:MAG: Hpt domain-containing protein [Gammaproteobacteria bacterium]